MSEPESDFVDEGNESEADDRPVAMPAGYAREPEPRAEARTEVHTDERREARPEPAAAMAAPRPMRDREPRRESSEREPRRESERDERTPSFTESELAETSRRVTADLLAAMGFEAKVEVAVQGTRADVTAEVSRDDDLLNGRKGEVRQALQHLLNRFLNRGEGSHYHLQLEINDFWKRRELELEEMARSLATQAAESRTEVVTEYLNSQERRIVHVTLKEDPRVRTYALGTGMIKRVAVAPADFPERSGDDEA